VIVRIACSFHVVLASGYFRHHEFLNVEIREMWIEKVQPAKELH